MNIDEEIGGRRVHPSAQMFPMLTGREYSELVESVKSNGLLMAILVDDQGRIVDGRNRMKACKDAGIAPRFEKCPTDKIVSYIVGCNLHRRNLTTGQKASIGAKLLPQYQEEAAARQAEGRRRGGGHNKKGGKKRFPTNSSESASEKKKSEPEAVDQAAKDVGVGRQMIQRMKKLHAEAPDLAKAVEDGSMSVNKAYKELQRRTRSMQDSEEGKVKSYDGLVLIQWANKVAQQFKHAESEFREAAKDLRGLREAVQGSNGNLDGGGGLDQIHRAMGRVLRVTEQVRTLYMEA